jgi:ABC-type nitrate/sulfonate/bicarbonate transport system permease component
MQTWRWFREAAYPWLVATQMVPIPAVAPILVLWFGFTIVPKAATVALMCFFPVAVNTVDGLSAVNPELIRLLRTFGAGPWRAMSMAALPSALPRIFSGLRVAMALSVVGAVVGEWVGSTKGLGYLMLRYENRGETVGLFATVAVLIVMGIILFFLVAWVENWAISWKRYAKETL